MKPDNLKKASHNSNSISPNELNEKAKKCEVVRPFDNIVLNNLNGKEIEMKATQWFVGRD